MTESVALKMLLGAFLATACGLNAKIIWDWLSRPKNNNSEICTIKDEMAKINPEIDDIKEKLAKISKTLSGNGEVEKSIIFRLTSIEQFIKELQRVKESRSL